MDELKPCPFCGSEPNNTPNHTIICNTCHREVLPDVWQTRPIEDALQKRVEELETNIKEAVKEIDNNIVYLNRLQAEYQYKNKDASEIKHRKHGWILANELMRKHGLMEDK